MGCFTGNIDGYTNIEEYLYVQRKVCSYPPVFMGSDEAEVVNRKHTKVSKKIVLSEKMVNTK